MQKDFAVVWERLYAESIAFKTWHNQHYASQDRLWDVADSVVKAHSQELQNQLDAASQQLGSLQLDPELKFPPYLEKVDIHRMPGGYGPKDVAQGAFYTVGVDAFFRGWQSGYVGAFAVAQAARRFPGLTPARILDVGCGAGNSMWAWCEAFPHAEIHGVDAGAGLLKFARIESVARKVHSSCHFKQASAEDMTKLYPEGGSFDLVVSHIVFHETSEEAIANILRECLRVLRPGGVMLHIDVCSHDWHYNQPRDRFFQHWQTVYNGELFGAVTRSCELETLRDALASSWILRR